MRFMSLAAPNTSKKGANQNISFLFKILRNSISHPLGNRQNTCITQIKCHRVHHLRLLMWLLINFKLKTRQGNTDHSSRPRLAGHARPDLARGGGHPLCLVLPQVLFALLILRLRIFFGINKAWPYKDLKGWDFQQIVESSQIVAYRPLKSEALHSLPSGGNILLLDPFCFLVIL